MSSDRVAKVAIVGGGCSAITTAFELSRPSLKGRYEITVYQEGWRLGGKGASGRGPSGRIEEHGLHFWLGFYDNAFRLLRECYAEIADAPGDFNLGDWRDAFIPENDIGVSARSLGDAWHSWSACFQPLPGSPGDPITTAEMLSLRGYLGRAIGLLKTLLEGQDSRSPAARAEAIEARFLDPRQAAPAPGEPARILAAIQGIVGGAASASAAILIEALAVLQAGLKLMPSLLANPLTDLAEWVAHSLRQWLERRVIDQPYYQHVWEVMDLVVATIVGVFRFGLLMDPRGFDAIDDYECREWLKLNGASERAVQSGFIRGLYDLAMAYEDGDESRPGLAAGQAMRGSLRMFFGYRGALFWRMRAGMGDVVFAPFYEVLRRRGVKFKFFHRLTNVRLNAVDPDDPGAPRHVAGLDFDVQARIKGGGAYQPLVQVGGRPCWPSSPHFDQLVGGTRARTEGWDFESHWDRRRAGVTSLEVIKDFDFVVLGVSVGAIPHVCPEILAVDPRWRRMTEAVKTVATQSLQIWLDRDVQALGWRRSHLVGSAFAKPFDTWCDMAHTVPEEAWSEKPKTVLYFCGVLRDPPEAPADDDIGYPARRREDVRRHVVSYLGDTARHLWPMAYDADGEFRWEMLRDASDKTDNGAGDEAGPTGEARLATQYWRANVNPTDRYVLALPGTLKHRISPLDMTYDNLTIAGDWTDCGFNEGCVEAAVMSGRLAAHAIAGTPLLEDIVGFDHP